MDENVPRKMKRLKTWCKDVNNLTPNQTVFDFVYVDYEKYQKYQFSTFNQIMDGFRKYK